MFSLSKVSPQVLAINFPSFPPYLPQHFARSLAQHQGRGADGRAVLRSSVREFLVSEVSLVPFFRWKNLEEFMGKNPGVINS